MEDLFLNIDYCSSNPELKIEGFSRKRSYYGALLSVLILLVIAALTIYLGLDIFKKENPQVLIENGKMENYVFKNFTYDSFFVGYKVVDYLRRDIPKQDYEKYIDVSFANVISTRLPNISYNMKFYETEDCTKLQDVKINITNGYTCPKNFSIEMGGDEIADKYNFGNLVIRRCVSRPFLNKICASDSEINLFLSKGINLQLVYKDHNIMPKNNTNPILENIILESIPISQSVNKIIYYNFEHLIINTDNGLIFEEFHEINSIKLRNRERDFVFGSAASNSLVFLLFNLNSNYLSISRKYIKAQELTALIGGMAKFLLIISYFLTNYINNKEINLMLMNHIFNYEGICDETGEIIKGGSDKELKLEKNTSSTKLKKLSNIKISQFSNSRLNAIKKTNNLNNQNNQNNLNNESENKKDEEPQLNLNKNESNIKNQSSVKLQDLGIQNLKSDNLNDLKFGIKNKDDNLRNILLKNHIITEKENVKIKFSFLEIIMSFLCIHEKCKREKLKFKENQYEKSLQTVYKSMSIDFIINKLCEIDYLKAILLSNEQSLCFDYFYKPTISYDGSSLIENGHISKLIKTQNLHENDKINIIRTYLESQDDVENLNFYENLVNKKILSLMRIS